jgi:hypothetical protein
MMFSPNREYYWDFKDNLLHQSFSKNLLCFYICTVVSNVKVKNRGASHAGFETILLVGFRVDQRGSYWIYWIDTITFEGPKQNKNKKVMGA